MALINKKWNSSSISVGEASSQLVVELDGAQHRVIEAISDLPAQALAAGIKAQRLTAERIKKDIRKAIRENRAPGVAWDSLTPKTKKIKAKKGKDPSRIWYWSGAIYNNIVINNYKNRVVVTVRKGKVNKETGGKATLAEIAKLLEHGTDKLVPRPLWQPIYEDYKKNGVLKRLTIYHIKRNMMKNHGVKAII